MGTFGLLRRSNDPVDLRWLSVRRWFLAFVVAAFPFLFIIDAAVDPAVSPVLPGIVALLVVWLAGPFVTMELWQRFAKPTPGRAPKYEFASRFILAGAAFWFFLWLVLT